MARPDSETARIVVVGSSNTDFVVQARSIPAPGETVLGSSFFSAAGGKGANQAVAAARLGARVTLVARLGYDSLGDAAVEALQAEGVRTDYVVRETGAPSGVALIVVDEEGENAIAVASGANDRLCPDDVDRAGEEIGRADIVLLQLETPLETVRHAAKLAAEHGATVILNPAPARPLDAEVLRHVTVLTPNAGEAAVLSGLPVVDEASARRAARVLRGRGAANVIVTLGPRGALVEGEQSGHLPAPAVQAVDTTAAGDAFNGALAVGLAEGRSLVDAVGFANRAAAISVTRVGAQPSLPARHEVDSEASP